MAIAIEMNFTVADYLAAIERELSKRATTYPKIIARMIKKKETTEAISNEIDVQKLAVFRLSNARFCFQHDFVAENSVRNAIQFELNREYKMRKKCYPRWIWYYQRSDGKSGISEETALFETAVWKSLITHFENNL
jgi:hypothetical protein